MTLCLRILRRTSANIDLQKLFVIDWGEDLTCLVHQVELIRQKNPSARIVVLTKEQDWSTLRIAVRAGANACLTYASSCEKFIKSLELVVLGETILPTKIVAQMLEQHQNHEDPIGEAGYEDQAPLQSRSLSGPDPAEDGGAVTDQGHSACHNTDRVDKIANDTVPRLSPRQEAILRYLIEGNSNKAIARKIALSEATVKVHIKTILRKIHVHNRTQAAIWGISNCSNISGPSSEPHGTASNAFRSRDLSNLAC